MSNINVKNLKQYVKDDAIYQDYKKDKGKNFSDFDNFCINHCKDIEAVLEYNAYLENELKNYEKKWGEE